MHTIDERDTRHDPCRLSGISAEFAGWVAMAVWLRRLTEEAAREALWSYAMASHSGAPRNAATMLEALVAEYRRRREQQDICW